MRVLHALHNYPPEFRGGVERVVEGLCRSLALRGHQGAVLAGSERRGDRAAVEREEWEGTPVFRFRRAAGFRTAVFPWDRDLPDAIDQAIAAFRPEVVHVHHHWNLSDDVIRRFALRGIPAVFTFHDFFPTCALFFRLRRGADPCDATQGLQACGPCLGEHLGLPAEPMGRLARLREREFRLELAAARAVLAPSQAHADALEPHVDGPVRVLPPGSGEFPAAGGVGRLSGAPLTLLHFGHFSALKGTGLLVRAVRSLDPDGTRIRLVLAGSDLSGDLDLEGFERHPDYDRESLARLAAQADLAVFPSLARETYGLVVDEALRLGLPVVVSDRGALSERIGARGVVVRAGDGEHLRRVLAGFLERPEDLDALRRAEAPPLPSEEAFGDSMIRIYGEAADAGPAGRIDLDASSRCRIGLLSDLLAEVLMPGPGGGGDP